jgi:type I restriction enzyme M protein
MGFSTLFDLHTRDLKSEAEVETRLLAPLFKDLGYPVKSVIPKKQLAPLVVYSGSKKTTVEADFLLFGHAGSARVVVEAKDPKKSVQEAWGQAASYALSYNANKPDAERIKWLLISNGHITSLHQHDSSTPTVTLELSDFASGSPPYATLRSYIKFVTAVDLPAGGLSFEITPPQKLNDLFNRCHDLIWKKEKMNPTDAFFEFCKFIFIKIGEDKKRETIGADALPHTLPMTVAWLNSLKSTAKHPVRDLLFNELRNSLESQIAQGKKRIFEPNETLKLSAATCRELIKLFETINLSSIDEDLNGRMFEVFLNAAIRGRALGQYFTPRPLVDFMTRIALANPRDISDPPKVIDACCGTAGFLIEVMAYLVSSLRTDTRMNAKDRNRLANLVRNERLFGIEANERVSRIARINMYLHGDGGSHIFWGDGLDKSPESAEDMSAERKGEVQDHTQKIQPGTFDLVLTNPPFSMSYSEGNQDEERILRQLTIADGASSVKSNLLFLQRYCDLLKPGGEMLIVLDDTVLNGTTHRPIREWVLESFVVVGIHSMPFNAFFKAKANIKTSVLHLRKKRDGQDTQGHVFMSISNNIGHDNALKDTLERNNLTDILNAYFEWRRTGKMDTIIRQNQDAAENLECPEQIWLVKPDDFSVERFDAFAYAPDLDATFSQIRQMTKAGSVNGQFGSAFTLRAKMTGKERAALRESGERLKYIEIGDVTQYGLITQHITGKIDELPSRGQYRIKTGDVLMAINNSSRGTVVLVPNEFNDAICTSGFLVIHPKNQDEGLLLWYSLRSELCRKQIYYLAQTASQPELKRRAWLKQFVVPMPSDKQRAEATAAAAEFQSHITAILSAENVRL